MNTEIREPTRAEIDGIVAHLREDFSIHHCTLQVEQGTTRHAACCLSNEHDGHDHDHAHAGHAH